MADAPSRAVVIFADGFLPDVAAQHSNLHSLAQDGCCGFLALRSSDCDANSDALIQLLDIYDSLKDGKSIQPISERFMGMNAAMVTNSEQAGVVGSSAGFTVSRLQDFHDGDDVSTKLLEMVGDSAASGRKSFDLLLLHIGAHDDPTGKSPSIYSIDWIDSVVGKLKAADSKNLLLVLVLGYGNALPQVNCFRECDQQLLQLRPRQSYCIKAGKPVENISNNCSLVAVYFQKAVTRRDHCTRLDLEELRQNCGNLTILADSFLHEVAFKLWKAPKYGA